MESIQIKTKVINTLEYIAKISLLLLGFIVLVYRNTTLQEFFEYLFLSFFKDDKKILYSKICSSFYNAQESFISLFWTTLILLIVIKFIVFVLDKNNKNNFKDVVIQYSLCKNFKEFIKNSLKALKNFGEINEPNKKSYLHKKLSDYIESSNNKAFVVDGEWGSGKTYAVKNFIDEYFKYNKQKPIYISCFGVSTREQIEKLIKLSYENNDETIKAKFNSFIKSIPLFGEPLQDFFKPKYDFKSMKEKSVFIFDDFERICECYESDNISNLIKNNPSIDIAPIFQNEQNIKYKSSLEKSLENIASTFLKLNSLKFHSKNFNKFNAISGVISELIENYNMKVVIICNRKHLDLTMFNELFHNKISSIIYKFELESREEKIKNLITDALTNIIGDNKKANKIETFLNTEKNNIIGLWKYCNFKNLRYVNNIIISFIELINDMNSELVDESIFGDIFYSIFLNHIGNYCYINNVPYSNSSSFVLGDALTIILRDAKGLKPYFDKEKPSSNINLEFLKKYAYVGDNISSYWHSGLKFNPIEIQKDLESFCLIKKDHLILKFYKTEYNLDNFKLIEILNSIDYFRIQDLLFCLNQLAQKELLSDDISNILNYISTDKCLIKDKINLDYFRNLLFPLPYKALTETIIPNILINNFDLLEKLFIKFYSIIDNNTRDIATNYGKNSFESKYNNVDLKGNNCIKLIELFDIFVYLKEISHTEKFRIIINNLPEEKIATIF